MHAANCALQVLVHMYATTAPPMQQLLYCLIEQNPERCHGLARACGLFLSAGACRSNLICDAGATALGLGLTSLSNLSTLDLS